MNFTKDQLPVRQFERIGIPKNELGQLSKSEMNTLLSGHPGPVKPLAFKDNDGVDRHVNAKLSLYQTSEGNLALKIHPFRKEIKNDLHLTPKEIEQLKSGGSITKTQDSHRFLIQLDPSINELRRIRTDQIKVADKIGNTGLTTSQKEDLRSGKTILIKDLDGKEKRIGIDLTSPSGIRVESRHPDKHKSPVDSMREIKESNPQEQTRMKR